MHGVENQDRSRSGLQMTGFESSGYGHWTPSVKTPAETKGPGAGCWEQQEDGRAAAPPLS